ncbi:hypothetical protein MMC30_006155 [Trapelia coarctata]|nr:hypothetical protein [Trapelia coarctata]
MSDTELSGLSGGMEAHDATKAQTEATGVIEAGENNKAEDSQVQSTAAEESKLPLWKLFATAFRTGLRLKFHIYVFLVGKLFAYEKHHRLPKDKDGDRYKVPELGWIAALASMDKELGKENT